jgi:hypothetical protein
LEFFDFDWSRERSFSSDVDCLLDARSGRVTLTLYESGCFHYEDGGLASLAAALDEGGR